MSKLAERVAFNEEVKRAVEGRWVHVYRCLLPSNFLPALDAALKSTGAYKHFTCPFHGGKEDFRFDKKHVAETGLARCTCGTWDGFSLLMKARGWDFSKTCDEVWDALGGRSYRAVPAITPTRITSEQQRQEDTGIKDWLQRIAQSCVPLNDPAAKPARLFFRERKLGEVRLPLSDVLFHPGLSYKDDDGVKLGTWPAIICVVRMQDGRVSTLHRTWITQDGRKAPVPKVRKQCSSPSTNPVVGASVKLDAATGPVLNIGEGLESALAARAITVQPTWSTLNKELLRFVQIPANVRQVTIWADRDNSYGGQLAAIELMDRLRAEGRSAVVMLPPFEIPEGKKTIDWNDVVASIGLDAARKHFNVVRWQRGQAEYLRSLQVNPDTVRLDKIA